MGREEAVDPFEDLKQHSIRGHQIKEINISEAVMNRINTMQSGKQTQGLKSTRRFPVYAAVIFIALLASASVYAASQFIEIRDRAGDVKIKSVILKSESQIFPYSLENELPKPTYRDRVLELVKPGQLLAYYVRGSSSSLNIQYLHNTNILSSYDDFKELLVRTSAPIIKEPTNMPEGFTFKYGSVMPLTPNEHDTRTSAEYARLLTLFKQRTEADPKQQLFVEVVNWSEANTSELEYEKDAMNIRIIAMKDMIRSEVALSAKYTQQVVDIDGIEIIFASGSMFGFTSYEAIWYDEVQKTHYQVTASGNVDLTEKQFKLIVKSLVD